ncbi:uncharacterized protein LOC126977530 isoform X2 [Leptidea sinapis]|uniref:uncharacterized protein LOC126977530 isoform X2 n=1 Tax=Leptidea sinapis TaxID=189913 RepID=UPI0021C4C4BA|nr:uncharacterized protein LOC126977530 isoform X2 [Leptidea sinapis]
MRKLLTLALLLYDVIDANRFNYDYEEPENVKRQSFADDRRNWRKKALLKSFDQEPMDWVGRREYEQEVPRNYDDAVAKSSMVRRIDYDAGPGYAGAKNIEEKQNLGADKEPLRKSLVMNCERPNERYEACFAGCSSITCDNPRERLRACYPFCEPGCICVQPYVRDDRTHKCVLPENCTKGLKGIPDLNEEI